MRIKLNEVYSHLAELQAQVEILDADIKAKEEEIVLCDIKKDLLVVMKNDLVEKLQSAQKELDLMTDIRVQAEEKSDSLVMEIPMTVVEELPKTSMMWTRAEMEDVETEEIQDITSYVASFINK